MASTTDAGPKPYLHGHHASVLRSHSSRTARNSCPHLLPHLRPDMRILDVGCGPGTITTDLATLVPGGHVTGVDYSAAVLDGAHAHAASLGVPNVAFAQADVCGARGLPFPDGAFDVVHTNQLLQHLRDPVAAVREMRRVAKPIGGIVSLREADAPVWYPGDDDAEHGSPGRVLHEWRELGLRMARDAGLEPNTGRRLLSMALRAGFAREEVSARSGSQCWSTREELRFWCGMWADRTLQSEFAEKAVGGGYATREELERLSRAWREFGEGEDSWYALMQGEAILTRSG